MLDWHLCQICYPLEIKLLLLFPGFVLKLIQVADNRPNIDMEAVSSLSCVTHTTAQIHIIRQVQVHANLRTFAPYEVYDALIIGPRQAN